MLNNEHVKPVVGYTTGVFDLFHVGHLNLLRNSKGLCHKLIVGVSTDEVVLKMKKKVPIIPFHERCEILEALPYVDAIVAQEESDYVNKFLAWERYKFDIIFVGSDWQHTEKWTKLGLELEQVNSQIIYLPYTKTTSSSKIREILDSYKAAPES